MPKTSRFTGLSALFHPSFAAVLLAGGGLMVGCGDDDRPPPPIVRPDGGGGDDDAGAGVGGGGSGGTGGTGGDEDASVDDFELSGPCVADSAEIHTYVPLEANPQGAPSLGVNGLNFGLVFAAEAECSDAVQLARLASNQNTPASAAAIDECSATRNAVGAALAGGDWLLAWLDGRDGDFQVMATRLDPDATPPLTPPTRTPLSDSGAIKGSLVLTLLTDTSAALLAWTETDGAGENGAIKIRALDPSNGEATESTITLQETPGQLYTALALTALPEGGAVLGYVAGAGPRRSIYLQQLSAEGAAEGEPRLLSADGDANATVSIAMKDETTDRGAVAYSVNPAGMRPGIRFHALDEDGAPVGQYRVATSSLERASAIGIVPTLGGFAVAYRAISDFNWGIGRIRVAFLNDTGGRIGGGANDVAEASDYGGAPTLAIALDGRMTVAWYDDDEGGGNRTLKWLKYPCNR